MREDSLHRQHWAGCTRRDFIRRGAALALAAPFVAPGIIRAAQTPTLSNAKVSVVACRGYGPEVRTAMKQAFDQLGGIGALVKEKTVTIKINLTGLNFSPWAGRPPGESYLTHYSTVLALTSLLFDAGARRVRLVESTVSRATLEESLVEGSWDLHALTALGRVEFENTRNLGLGKQYAELKVPGGGLLFSSFQLNHAYDETDVMISLCKLKEHMLAGVTLSMKNMYGLTPNALYSDEAGQEGAIAPRGDLHSAGFASKSESRRIAFPGLKTQPTDARADASTCLPRIITDICAARPIHLSIIDGITTMSGGEGPWCGYAKTLKLIKPGVLIVGLNPVSTDAVGTAVMGFANPRAPRGQPPFDLAMNHLLVAEESGLGTADLSKIDLRGLTIEQALTQK